MLAPPVLLSGQDRAARADERAHEPRDGACIIDAGGREKNNIFFGHGDTGHGSLPKPLAETLGG